MPSVAVLTPGADPQTVDSQHTTAKAPLFSSALAAHLVPRAQRGSVVEPARTPLRGGEAASALASAWQSIFHQAPTPQQLSVLTAQWSLETGGGRAMMNYNFGGIKGTGPSGLTAAYTTKEGSGSSEKTIVDRFRAYASPAEGATDYLHLLQSRYPDALKAAHAGQPAEFVRALKKGGYFTGSETSYVHAVTQLSDRALSAGFDAIGGPGGAAGPRVSAPVHAQQGPVRASTGSNDLVDGKSMAVDVLAFSYQLDQAAMNIARSEQKDSVSATEVTQSRRIEG